MAFVLRVFDTDNDVQITELYISAGSIDRKLDSSSSFSISVPSNTVAAGEVEEGQIAELWLDGVRLLTGEIQSIGRGVLAVDKAISLKGRDILDTLFDVIPDPTFTVENVSMLQALHLMLAQYGWRLGDISTVTDKDFVVESLDLRNERSFLDQFRKILEIQEGLSLVVGEDVLGNHTLDIGTFDADSGALFRSPANRYYNSLPDNFNIITKLQEKKSNEARIYYMEAVGGKVKDSFDVNRSITLYDAWDNDNALAYDPEFPIIEIIPGQRYAILNLEELPKPGGLFSTVHGCSQHCKVYWRLWCRG